MEKPLNYTDVIKELNLKYPFGIPSDIVFVLCARIEMYYLQQLINETKETNKIYDRVGKYIDGVKLYNTFSKN